ncbi:hypothetical protein LTR53_016472 [Teratosphaeriaceae sp. CCFEE 6253]|nr:hypothetical protein LTR53_016472 [Teratosphaeriaceae sp. CCFEE 6253]
MREKRRSAPRSPVVTSGQNHAYFTGLDTSSQGSHRGDSGEYYAPSSAFTRRSEGGTFADPPPPYKSKSLASNRTSAATAAGMPDLAVPALAAAAVPVVREPSGPHDRDLASPFADPVLADDASETSTIRGGVYAPTGGIRAVDPTYLSSPVLARPSTGASRTPSQRSTFSAVSAAGRSINSDAYSDTASLHSARAARLSVGGSRHVLSLGGSRDEGNPFHDVHAEEHEETGLVSPVEESEDPWGLGVRRTGSKGSAVSGLSGRR